MTKLELELIPDRGMYIFFEKGTRGGISCISNRYSKANNKYLKFCDPKQESKNIIYTHIAILQIAYIVIHCLNFVQQVDSNGQILKSLTRINILAIVPKDVFLKLILNILKSYENSTIIIL